jgi:hypothetical protein
MRSKSRFRTVSFVSAGLRFIDIDENGAFAGLGDLIALL